MKWPCEALIIKMYYYYLYQLTKPLKSLAVYKKTSTLFCYLKSNCAFVARGNTGRTTGNRRLRVNYRVFVCVFKVMRPRQRNWQYKVWWLLCHYCLQWLLMFTFTYQRKGKSRQLWTIIPLWTRLFAYSYTETCFNQEYFAQELPPEQKKKKIIPVHY